MRALCVREDTSQKEGHIILTCTCACVLSMCMVVSAQDPAIAELECNVNGVATTTTAVTFTAPVLMPDDESGAMSLTYDMELLSTTRGGPYGVQCRCAR